MVTLDTSLIATWVHCGVAVLSQSIYHTFKPPIAGLLKSFVVKRPLYPCGIPKTDCLPFRASG